MARLALAPAPSLVASSVSSSPNLAIVDLTTVSDNLVVSGAGTFLVGVKLTTNLTHTYNNDLIIDLTAAWVKDNYEIRLNVANAADDTYYIGGYQNTPNRVIPGELRSYNITLRYSF